MEPYKVVSEKMAFKGKIIDVAHDVITLPDGREALREVVLHGDAAAIVPVDQDGNIIFVRQYRHPARAMMLEIPAGCMEEGEDPLECATRELEEETGMKAGTMRFASKTYMAVGYCTESIYFYVAEGLMPGKQNLDEDEFVSVEKYSLEQSLAMVMSGEINDSKTVMGILYYQQMKQ